MPPPTPPKKPDLASYSVPEGMKRRGSFVVREALKIERLRQHPRALKNAAYILLLLPFIQSAILVGILNAEPWLLLLSAEGLLIAWLAYTQLKRATPENRLIGYGIGVLNIVALSVVGAFLGAPVLWITGIFALLPFTWLLFKPTGRRTLAASWAAFLLPLVVLAGVAGFMRQALEQSRHEQDPVARLRHLNAAWDGLQLRGYNGTERALLRLRQAQAAFDAGHYELAFYFAHDGVQDRRGETRPIPVGLFGEELLESLMRVKAQAYYNARWGKDESIATRIQSEAIRDDWLKDRSVRVLWGW
jgi:hypothetical protein